MVRSSSSVVVRHAPLALLLCLVLTVGVTVWLAFVAYVVVFGGIARRSGDSADVADYEREALAPTA